MARLIGLLSRLGLGSFGKLGCQILQGLGVRLLSSLGLGRWVLDSLGLGLASLGLGEQTTQVEVGLGGWKARLKRGFCSMSQTLELASGTSGRA